MTLIHILKRGFVYIVFLWILEMEAVFETGNWDDDVPESEGSFSFKKIKVTNELILMCMYLFSFYLNTSIIENQKTEIEEWKGRTTK